MQPGDVVLVTGAGGFIGSHLVSYLKQRGYKVIGADIKPCEFSQTDADKFVILDLRERDACCKIVKGVDHVFHLAANMGGIGFIETHRAEIVHDNTLINMHTLEAARQAKVKKFLFTSSACVYPGYRQREIDATPLREVDAYPADAEDGYGWEKLFMERACRHYFEDYGLKTYSVRFHNIFGPLGTYDGGREKSPAAISRKIAVAPAVGEIEVWGDGQQTRSYCYVDDCVEGLYRLMMSDHHEPLNLGQDRLISINELVDMIATIANKKITKRYDVTKPQGVRGRNSDNSLLRKILRWEPSLSLEEGLRRTYAWIDAEVHKTTKVRP